MPKYGTGLAKLNQLTVKEEGSIAGAKITTAAITNLIRTENRSAGHSWRFRSDELPSFSR